MTESADSTPPSGVSAASAVEPESGIRFLTTAQAAELLGYSKASLEAWRYNDTGPVYYRFGGNVRYRSDELIAWASQDSNRVVPGSSRAA